MSSYRPWNDGDLRGVRHALMQALIMITHTVEKVGCMQRIQKLDIRKNIIDILKVDTWITVNKT